MPPTPRVRFGSSRKNFSKIRSCSAGGMPSPSSVTRNRTRPPLRPISTSTRPPSGEYLIALSIRLVRIWRSLSGIRGDLRQAARLAHDDLDPLRRPRAQDVHHLGGDRRRVAPLDRDAHAARLEPARPEDVVHDAREPVGLARDDLEQPVALRLLDRDVAAPQGHRRAVDRGERRAELVRHGRDEVRLHLLHGPLVGDVAERVHGAAREADGGDRQPPLLALHLHRQRLRARGAARLRLGRDRDPGLERLPVAAAARRSGGRRPRPRAGGG